MTHHQPKPYTIVALLALQACALLAIVLLTWPAVFASHKMDVTLYFRYSQNFLSGQAPYRDFAMEYPPLALLSFTLPRLTTLGHTLDFDAYVRLFLFENAVFVTLAGLVLAEMLRDWQLGRVVPDLAIYGFCVAILAPLLPWRFDMFPALLSALALLSVLRERPGWAGIWLGLGAAAKLYPLVLLPIFGAYYLAGGRASEPGQSRTALIRLALGSAAAGLLALLPFALAAHSSIVSFLRYHELRGLQVESLPAGAIILAHVLGLTSAQIGFNYGSVQLISPPTAIALRWLPLALVAVYAAVLGAGLLRFREERAAYGAVTRESLVAYSVAALLAFIVTNKVFSPQYLIWLLPFAPLLRPGKAGLFALICAITIALFPFDYNNLLAMQPLPVVLLNLRNLLIVALLIWLVAERLPLRRPFAWRDTLARTAEDRA